MSINNHLGREISRRDDMEALLYMAVYLRNGQLPWRDLQGGPLEKNRQTGELPLKMYIFISFLTYFLHS